MKMPTTKIDFYNQRQPLPIDKEHFTLLHAPHATPYPEDLSAARDYLFCLPYDPGQFYLCLQQFLPFIQERQELVTLVIHQSLYTLVRELDPRQLLPLLVTELDRHQFPTGPELLNLLNRPYKVAADFNYPSLAMTTFLVTKSKARYKIGLQSPYAEELFNVVISCSGDDVLENAYQRILQLVSTQLA